jgi:hypothetical protein
MQAKRVVVIDDSKLVLAVAADALEGRLSDNHRFRIEANSSSSHRAGPIDLIDVKCRC